MKRNGTIVSYTADEIRELIKREGSKSDWAANAAMTEEELEAAIASDPDEAGIVWDPDSLTTELPSATSKSAVSIRLDPDVLDFFRDGGKGYQTRINAVLRSYMEQTRKKAG